jgi:CheY-like chemotaxis protein/anti-sigma regulatory factor (Ser/Thr protein kinase)
MSSLETERLALCEANGDVGVPTVLIVDDYLIDRRRAGAVVEKVPGLRAAYAGDGAEALETIDRERPAIVLTDLQMPGIDGLALVQQVRRRHPGIPVILMTAHGSEEVAMEALRAGAASYVPKRLLNRELVATLRQILSVGLNDRRKQRLLGSMKARSSYFQLGNDPDLLTPLVELCLGDLAGMGLGDETLRIRVGIALQESLANALYHGNLEVSSDLRQEDERLFYGEAARRAALDPYRTRSVHVEARLDTETATYVIRDEGPGFDTSRLDRPFDPEDLTRIGGRGLLLIRTFMDEVVHNTVGNQITLIKRCPQA